MSANHCFIQRLVSEFAKFGLPQIKRQFSAVSDMSVTPYNKEV